MPSLSVRVLLVSAAVSFCWAPASEAAARVFVSVSGNDLNTCSNIATPCRTLDAGVTQVDAAGEVIVLTTGSYAGATITKAVRVNVPTGVVAFSASTVTVDPGAGNVVVLRGLTIKALTPGTGTGIDHQSGILFVENTLLDGWQSGLVAQSGAQQLYVKGSVFRNQSSYGLRVAFGSTAAVAVDDSFFERNLASGAHFFGGTGRVSSSVMTGNDAGAVTAGLGTEVTFQRCEVAGNLLGLVAQDFSVLRVAQSTLTRNGTGLHNSTATAESFGNNVIRGNTAETVGTITPVTLQ